MKAIQKITEVEKAFPRLSVTKELQAAAYYMQNDYKKALDYYQQAFAANMENLDAYKMVLYLEKCHESIEGRGRMKIRSSIFILLVFPLLFSFSPVPAQMGNSLEWQKIELEKSIRDQVVSTIAPVILSGEYIVNVAVKARPPQNIKPTPGGGAEKKIQE